MKVLTIKQPFASLIMHGFKKIETRGWIPKNPKIIEQIKEEGLLIHAGAGKGKHEIELFNGWKNSHLYNSNFRGVAFNDLPFGAIIGKVNVVEMYSIDSILEALSCNDGSDVLTDNNGITLELSKKEFAFGDYSPNRFGWLLSNPIIFEEPIPAKGQLGLWNFDLKIQ